ncbi:MAG: nucleotidyltransferase family protein [Clostridiales bacterium]|nr:nucleotidyltransferase family protein [Clostridiales bacterium]
MKIVGIIAEYNPFHRGHLYHLQQAKKTTGADGVLVVLSGNYVQRGEPAIVDKYRRTRMALMAGADIVLELPISYATGSGERFASGAVEILHKCQIVTDLFYGCECSDSRIPERLARLFLEEPPSYQKRLQDELRRGRSFPAAREIAAEEQIPGSRQILREPNNILAIEYLKALQRNHSSIRPWGLLRSGESYHSQELSPASMASASAIRQAFPRNSALDLPSEDHPVWAQIPEFCWPDLDYHLHADDFSSLLYYALQTADPAQLSQWQDMSNDLAIRTLAQSTPDLTFSELADRIKSRHMTRTRVNRALLHTMLRIPEIPAPIPAVHLLGFRTGTPLMRRLQDSSSIPIVTKMADADPSWFSHDIRADNIYRHILWEKTGLLLPDSYRRGPVIIS